jgi:hypothetical protein
MSNRIRARSFRRATSVAFLVVAALGVTGTAATAQLTASKSTGPTVKSWSPLHAAKGAKVTFRGTDLAGVTAVTWVIYPGPKDYNAKFTKSATTIVAISPVAFPSKTSPGLIEFKSKGGTTIVSCWGAC